MAMEILGTEGWRVLGAVVAAMGLGALWYGPLFGKVWLRVIGATALDLEARKEMQKRAAPLYLVQALLVVLQVLVLGHLVRAFPEVSALMLAALMWLGFVMPTVAAMSMWNNDSARVSALRFLLQGGYQLVAFLLFGFILSGGG